MLTGWLLSLPPAIPVTLDWTPLWIAVGAAAGMAIALTGLLVVALKVWGRPADRHSAVERKAEREGEKAA